MTKKCKIEIFDDDGKSEIIESNTFVFICKTSKGTHVCSLMKDLYSFYLMLTTMEDEYGKIHDTLVNRYKNHEYKKIFKIYDLINGNDIKKFKEEYQNGNIKLSENTYNQILKFMESQQCMN